MPRCGQEGSKYSLSRYQVVEPPSKDQLAMPSQLYLSTLWYPGGTLCPSFQLQEADASLLDRSYHIQ
jgi:hypothetical protein